jgi:uncharacterized protein (TIGR03663 family)
VNPGRGTTAHRLVPLGLLLAFIAALALRLPQLDARLMHNDEAVNAVKFAKLWEAGAFKYDPNEHHGPSIFYATLPFVWLARVPDFAHLTEANLRTVTVCFGLGVILLLPLFLDGLGSKAVLATAFFSAVSPAMVFYSRYYIHEMLLVFFTCLALGAAWRYWRSRQVKWALLAGLGVGLMYSTKETFLITMGAAALALGINHVWNRWLDASGLPIRAPMLNWWHVAAAAGICLLTAFVLFSSFFTNLSGPLDSIRTYLPWLKRAGGDSVHIHPWHFYFHRLLWFQSGKGPFWSEGFVLVLALVGALAAFMRKGLADVNASFVRFLALFSGILAMAYSLIAYKTPWCLLSFWLGMLLLAGVGASVIVNGLQKLGPVIVTLGIAQAAAQAWQASVPYANSSANPYVYAPTAPDVLNLYSRLATFPIEPLFIMAPDNDYWPLPWYVRRFKQTGYWDKIPEGPYPPLMLVSAMFRATLDEHKTYAMVRIYELRPQIFFELYVRLDVWKAWLAEHPPAPE